VVSQECAERGCMAHDDRVDGPGVVIERKPLTEAQRQQRDGINSPNRGSLGGVHD